jgi:hypothetical protein
VNGRAGVFNIDGFDILPVIFDQIKQFGSIFVAKENQIWQPLSIK